MLRKALIALYAIEALYLLVPWQWIVYGHIDLSHNEGIVTWLGAPGFYAAARLAARLGPTPGVRLGTAIWSVVWLYAALELNPDPHGFGTRSTLLLTFAAWIVLANLVVAVAPECSALLEGKPIAKTRLSSFALGVACWACLGVLMMYAGQKHPSFMLRLAALVVVPAGFASPVVAAFGTLTGFAELRGAFTWKTGVGLFLNGITVLAVSAVLALSLLPSFR